MSIAGTTFATSQRTIADLRTLAQESPAEAQRYLEGVAKRLPVELAKSIAAILEGTGSLVERIAAGASKLGQVFAPAPGEWGALQAARAGTIGWEAGVLAQAPTVLTGKVQLVDGAFVLEVPGLRPLKLAEGTANETLDGIPGQWMFGFMNDLPISVKGTLGADGLTFNVASFAPAKPGYETFTMARVMVEGSELYLRTPGGERLEVTNPELRAQFFGMHRLAVILPGEPDGKSYGGNPESFFALGRFRTTALQKSLDGTVQGFVDMAHEAMVGGHVRLPADAAPRVSHPWRVWLEGRFFKPEAGERPTGFAATYVSGMCDTIETGKWNSVPLLPKVAEAGAIDAARELAAP